uniref:Uncharacterized protein n=1 Tax=Caenorhabditis japonica TaxID=281687 RepID=A0A8R1E8X6_CAEJA
MQKKPCGTFAEKLCPFSPLFVPALQHFPPFSWGLQNFPNHCRESTIKSFTYLPPNATFELAMMRITEQQFMEAQTLLDKARTYKSYSLENKLHFRIHSAMGSMGCRTPMI